MNIPAQETRPTFTGVIPHLTVDGAVDAVAFYKAAFGAEELSCIPGENGKIIHACIVVNGAHVFLHDEFPDFGSIDPSHRGGSSVTMHIALGTPADVDVWYKRALDAGCTVEMELGDQFWGDRFGSVFDKWGHAWSFGAPLA